MCIRHSHLLSVIHICSLCLTSLFTIYHLLIPVYLNYNCIRAQPLIFSMSYIEYILYIIYIYIWVIFSNIFCYILTLNTSLALKRWTLEGRRRSDSCHILPWRNRICKQIAIEHQGLQYECGPSPFAASGALTLFVIQIALLTVF